MKAISWNEREQAAATVLGMLLRERNRMRHMPVEKFHKPCNDPDGCGRYLRERADRLDATARSLRADLALMAVCHGRKDKS